MQKVTPFLWFDADAEQAAELYVGLIPDSRILEVTRYGAGAPQPAGTAMSVTFTLGGVEYQAFNGGPHFRFNEAVSLFVSVDSQEEIDRLWGALAAGGGEPGRCGWIKDRFGLWWQIVPPILLELVNDPDPDRAARATRAMLAMSKLDIAALRAAHAGS